MTSETGFRASGFEKHEKESRKNYEAKLESTPRNNKQIRQTSRCKK